MKVNRALLTTRSSNLIIKLEISVQGLDLVLMEAREVKRGADVSGASNPVWLQEGVGIALFSAGA